MARPERILVIKLGAFGDFLLATGPMKAIRAHHPGAHIVLLTRKAFTTLGEACPFVDEVWEDPAPRAWQVCRWLGLRRRLREGGFSRVYDLQTSDRSGFYFLLMGPDRPEWSGIAKGCSHPHVNPKRETMHSLDMKAEQLAQAGIAPVPDPDVSWLSADVSALRPEGPYALLVPGGAPHRPEKRWPAGCFAEIGVRLLEKEVRPVLVGTPAERAALDEILETLPGAADLCGRTDFAQLAALARGAVLAVGNDTGPMHLAAAAGAPALVLFSAASDPARNAPRGAAVRTLQRPSLGQLAPDEVWTEIAKML